MALFIQIFFAIFAQMGQNRHLTYLYRQKKPLLSMNIGERIRKARAAKGLSQKEVALSIEMDQSQYSKIERGLTDPSISTVDKVIKALGMEWEEFFKQDGMPQEINSQQRTLMERLRLVEMLDEHEQGSLFTILDAFVSKKKLTNALSNVLKEAQ